MTDPSVAARRGRPRSTESAPRDLRPGRQVLGRFLDRCSPCWRCSDARPPHDCSPPPSPSTSGGARVAGQAGRCRPGPAAPSRAGDWSTTPSVRCWRASSAPPTASGGRPGWRPRWTRPRRRGRTGTTLARRRRSRAGRSGVRGSRPPCPRELRRRRGRAAGHGRPGPGRASGGAVGTPAHAARSPWSGSTAQGRPGRWPRGSHRRRSVMPGRDRAGDLAGRAGRA